MVRRTGSVLLLAVLLLGVSACHNKRVQNPIANLGSKQPDKVLFDRAMDSMKHNRFDTARMLLQTLINAYPDSEFIARAKLAVGDSWYAQGGATAFAQAENEYKDFITFFPNMPEAAEAQMKIANIHYRQMEKPDRDFTHAKRAEDEYRTMILQYPDSKLVPEATQHLREVQEVLAEREFLIGRFYFLRESYAAAMARLQTLVDTYPLYSGADEALYMLGNAYEKQYEAVKNARNVDAAAKERMGKVYADKAAEAYSRIVTRYPVMARSEDAKRRLEALAMPVPKPTAEAIAQNKAEEASRSQTGTLRGMMNTFHRGPDTAQASKVGEPSLTDPKPTSAPEIVRQTTTDILRAAYNTPGTGTANVKADVAVGKDGAPPPNQAAPRSSDTPPPTATPDKPAETGIPELPVTAPDPATQPSASGQPGTQPKADATTAPVPAPAQVNEVKDPAAPQAGKGVKPEDQASADKKKKDDKKKDDEKDSSNKKKKKKKLGIF